MFPGLAAEFRLVPVVVVVVAAAEEEEAGGEEEEEEEGREALRRKSGSKRLVRRNGPRWLTTMLFSMPRTNSGLPGIIPSRRLRKKNGKIAVKRGGVTVFDNKAKKRKMRTRRASERGALSGFDWMAGADSRQAVPRVIQPAQETEQETRQQEGYADIYRKLTSLGVDKVKLV